MYSYYVGAWDPPQSSFANCAYEHRFCQLIFMSKLKTLPNVHFFPGDFFGYWNFLFIGFWIVVTKKSRSSIFYHLHVHLSNTEKYYLERGWISSLLDLRPQHYEIMLWLINTFKLSVYWKRAPPQLALLWYFLIRTITEIVFLEGKVLEQQTLYTTYFKILFQFLKERKTFWF